LIQNCQLPVFNLEIHNSLKALRCQNKQQGHAARISNAGCPHHDRIMVGQNHTPMTPSHDSVFDLSALQCEHLLHERCQITEIVNAQLDPNKPVIENPWVQNRVPDELTRVKIFLGIQAFFLVLSVFTGGFNFKLWSMLDTALMIQSIGVTALVVVLEDQRHRRLAFKVAIVLYLLAVLDMGINVCISGIVGWRT
jgi:hypothetical protein